MRISIGGYRGGTGENPRVGLERLSAGRGESYSDFSRRRNRNPAYIQQFIKRGTPRKLDEEDRRILARYFGVAEEMLGGSAQRGAPPSRVRSLPSVVSVPRLSLGASAGPGRSEERRVGKEGVSTCRSRWSPYH